MDCREGEGTQNRGRVWAARWREMYRGRARGRFFYSLEKTYSLQRLMCVVSEGCWMLSLLCVMYVCTHMSDTRS